MSNLEDAPQAPRARRRRRHGMRARPRIDQPRWGAPTALGHWLRAERGQTIPVLLVAMTALLATGILLFQTGRAADLRAGAQTGADAAALAAGHELKRQLEALDGSLNVNEAAVEAAAVDYAQRNDSVLTAFDRDGYKVRVTVASARTLGGDEAGAAPDEDDEDRALARAEAEVTPLTGFNGFGIFGGLGATTEGLAPALKEAADLATEMGLTVSSTTGGVHAEGSFHYRGLAIDVTGDTGRMSDYFDAVLERYGSGQMLELFYDGEPAYYKNGQRVSGQFGGHGDHVHVAMPGNADAIGQDRRSVRDERDSEEEGGRGGDDTRRVSDDAGGDDARDDDEDDGGDSDTPSPCDGLPADAPDDDDDEDRGDGNEDQDDEDRARDADERRDDRESNAGPPRLSGVRDSQSLPAIVYAVGDAMGASRKEMLAAFEAAIVESGFRNLDYGDRDSLGIFQQRPSQGWGTPEQILNPFYAARKFFDAAMQTSGGTAGQLAQNTQRSAFPERYDQVEAQAEDLIRRVESGERPIIRGGLGAIAPCGLPVGGGSTVKLVEYSG